MPRVFDNIETPLLGALYDELEGSLRSDLCVGYFHLRGWGRLADALAHYDGSEDSCCRLLVGMHRPPEDEMRASQRARADTDRPDGPELARRRARTLEAFREQITFGIPSSDAREALCDLAADLRRLRPEPPRRSG